MEDRRKAAIEAVNKIEEVEAICVKVVDQVSQDWESLIEDVELEKVTEEIRTTDTEVTHLKNEMKRLPLVQNMDKVTEINKL